MVKDRVKVKFVEGAASCDTRGGRCKYVGICGSSRKLPRNIFVEAAVNGSNGMFYFHGQRKLPCTSMEVYTNFRGSKSSSSNFHGNFYGDNYSSTDSRKLSCMYIDFQRSFHGSWRKLPWLPIERKSPDSNGSLVEAAGSL